MAEQLHTMFIVSGGSSGLQGYILYPHIAAVYMFDLAPSNLTKAMMQKTTNKITKKKEKEETKRLIYEHFF